MAGVKAEARASTTLSKGEVVRRGVGQGEPARPLPHQQAWVVVGGTHSCRNVVNPPSVYQGTWR